MTFPTIPSTTWILFNQQTDTLAARTFPNLVGLSKNAGDLLIAVVAAYQASGTDASFSGWGAGFTELTDKGTSGSTMAIGVAYKWSDGTETGTFTVTQAGSPTGNAVTFLMSIPGAHPSTPPEAGGFATGTLANADPGSLSPSWGAEDTLWIAIGAVGETSTGGTWTGLTTTPPANYGNQDTASGTIADIIGALGTGIAFRQLNAASDDPGAFTNDISNTRWAGLTVAVRPVVATSVNAGLATATAAALDAPPPLPFTLLHTSSLASTSASGTLTITCTSSTAGNLLTASVYVGSSTIPSAPSGWAQRTSQATGTDNCTAIYDYIGNPGSVTSAAFTVAAASGGIIQEWVPSSGTAAVDQSGTLTSTSVTSPNNVSTSSALTAAHDIAVVVYGFTKTTTVTLGAGTGFTQGAVLNVSPSHATFDYSADTGASGSVLTDGVTSTSTGTADESGVIVTYLISSGVTANAGLATATADAVDAPLANAPAGLATATADAVDAILRNVSAGLVTATGTALNATVSTASGTTATAGLATATGTALEVLTPAVGVTAGLATATGTALSSVLRNVTAGLATATGTALAASPAVSATAGLATATGTALAATVSTSSGTSVNAGLASATADAVDAVLRNVSAGLATATGTALQQQAGNVISGALIVSGFGSFPQVPSGAQILAVVAQVNWFGSDAGITAPSYELWNGTTAIIGSPQPGTATAVSGLYPSTALHPGLSVYPGAATIVPGTRDTAVFNGVSYSQLATLQLRIYATSAPGNTGATVSVDAAGLSVEWAPDLDVRVLPSPLAVTPAFPAPSVSTGSTASPAVVPAVLALPAIVRSVSATVLPAPLNVVPVVAVPGASAGISFTVTRLAVVPALPLITRTPSAAVMAGPLAVTSVFPAVVVSTGAAAAPARIAVVTALPAIVRSVSATVLPGPFAVVPGLPGASASAGSTASPARLAAVTVLPAVTDITSPGYASAETTPGGTWTNPGNVTGPPDSSYAVWTVP